MTTQNKALSWVDHLPGVTPELTARRDQVRTLVAEAEKLTIDAAELTRRAGNLRAQAYQQSLSLEAEARGFCSVEEIERAKVTAG